MLLFTKGVKYQLPDKKQLNVDTKDKSNTVSSNYLNFALSWLLDMPRICERTAGRSENEQSISRQLTNLSRYSNETGRIKRSNKLKN